VECRETLVGLFSVHTPLSPPPLATEITEQTFLNNARFNAKHYSTSDEHIQSTCIFRLHATCVPHGRSPCLQGQEWRAGEVAATAGTSPLSSTDPQGARGDTTCAPPLHRAAPSESPPSPPSRGRSASPLSSSSCLALAQVHRHRRCHLQSRPL
jgi:hypothetical protein